jgi:hypothetical protein
MINNSPQGIFSPHAYYEKIRKRKSLCNNSSHKHYFLPPQERKTDEKMNLKDSIAVKCKLYGK